VIVRIAKYVKLASSIAMLEVTKLTAHLKGTYNNVAILITKDEDLREGVS
jgi:hypothetical protein